MIHVATWIRACDEEHFARCFAPYPQVRLWNARVESGEAPRAEGLLLTGGSDIGVEYLHQPVPDTSLVRNPDADRDAWEFAATKAAVSGGLPLLAICRGLQVLNVALGGTLHLDIPGHALPEQKTAEVQPLRYGAGAKHTFSHVNSSHHQALAELGAGLQVEAWCAEDEIIEQARLADRPFGLGVQYHPERGEVYRPLFEEFVAQVTAQSRR